LKQHVTETAEDVGRKTVTTKKIGLVTLKQHVMETAEDVGRRTATTKKIFRPRHHALRFYLLGKSVGDVKRDLSTS
jgi:hypothetical protein